MIKIIGLVDYDYEVSKKNNILIPNLEIMKLATYYKKEENRFCRLLSLDEEDLSPYEKIFFFSESHYAPQVPDNFLRAKQTIYGGTAFTRGKYIPFENEIIDFTIPRPVIYKESLKQKYNDGVKAKVISHVLDNSYYRCYAKERLPLPPILRKKRFIIYDREFFYPDWRDIINKISEKNPSSILFIHPIVCHKLSEFLEVRKISKLSRTNQFILDFKIPLDEVYYMLNKYKNIFLAEILKTSQIFLPLGGNYNSSFQYFTDMVYKLNLLYCFWSYKIPIKIKYEPYFIGYRNPLENLSKKIEIWSNCTNKNNTNVTIDSRVCFKTKISIEEKEKNLLLKFHPTAERLFLQTYNQLITGGRWRYEY